VWLKQIHQSNRRCDHTRYQYGSISSNITDIQGDFSIGDPSSASMRHSRKLVIGAGRWLKHPSPNGTRGCPFYILAFSMTATTQAQNIRYGRIQYTSFDLLRCVWSILAYSFMEKRTTSFPASHQRKVFNLGSIHAIAAASILHYYSVHLTYTNEPLISHIATRWKCPCPEHNLEI
jgi:hypothetical protein